MLSTAAGRIEVRGDTNASFRISRLPISNISSWFAFCTVVLVAVVAVDSYY